MVAFHGRAHYQAANATFALIPADFLVEYHPSASRMNRAETRNGASKQEILGFFYTKHRRDGLDHNLNHQHVTHTTLLGCCFYSLTGLGRMAGTFRNVFNIFRLEIIFDARYICNYSTDLTI